MVTALTNFNFYQVEKEEKWRWPRSLSALHMVVSMNGLLFHFPTLLLIVIILPSLEHFLPARNKFHSIIKPIWKRDWIKCTSININKWIPKKSYFQRPVNEKKIIWKIDCVYCFDPYTVHGCEVRKVAHLSEELCAQLIAITIEPG